MTDLFDGLDAAFRHQPLERPPSMFMMHRFLASLRAFAPHAAWMNLHVRDDDLAYEIWRVALPKQKSAPYLKYPAAGKPAAAGDLLRAMMDRYFWTREEAEDALATLRLADREEDVARYLGVELTTEEGDGDAQ